jgi:hypothetical protein
MHKLTMAHWLDLGLLMGAMLVYWTLIRTIQLLFSLTLQSVFFGQGGVKVASWQSVIIWISVAVVYLSIYFAVRVPWRRLFKHTSNSVGLRGKLQRAYLHVWAWFAMLSPVFLVSSVAQIGHSLS